MIVDSSALLAIIFREKGYEKVLDALATASAIAAGAPTLAETGIVLQARLGARADGLVGRLLDEFDVQEIPFGEIHWRDTIDAFRRFGKGRHPAALNFGDCMSYAVAKLAAEPLLYVGKDFSRTDIDSVL